MALVKGKDLVELAKKYQNKTTEELCEAAGYFSEKDGAKTFRQTELLRAIAEATTGFALKPVHRAGGNGREPSFHLKNGTTGTLPVNRAYTEMLGLEPGDMTDLTVLEPGNVFKANGTPALVIVPSQEKSHKAPSGALSAVG
jgi:hypothetical protein